MERYVVRLLPRPRDGKQRWMIAYFWGMALYSIHGWERDGVWGGVLLSQVSSSNWYAVFERFEIAPSLLNEDDRTLRPRKYDLEPSYTKKSQVVKMEGEGLL